MDGRVRFLLASIIAIVFILVFFVFIPLFRDLPFWTESNQESANKATIVSAYSSLIYTLVTVIGVLAAVFSLVFVGVQLRILQSSNEASALQNMVSTMVQINAATIEDKTVAEMWIKGNANLQDLDPADFRRFHLIAATEMTFYQNLWHQQRDQGTGQTMWRSLEKGLIQELDTPGRGKWWNLKKLDYDDDFRLYVDGLVNKKRTQSGNVAQAQRTTIAGLVGFGLGVLATLLWKQG